MKKALLSCLAILSFSANAAVVDFESGLDPIFNYDGVSVLSTPIGTSGYNTVTDFTGSTNLAFNPFEVSPSTFSWASSGTFDLTSFVIGGAWGSQTLTIEGLLNNTVTNVALFAVDNIQAGVFNANWSGIDAFRITTGSDFVQASNVTGTGQHWALDNVTVNENVSVPTPGTALLLGLGLAGLIISRKRNA